MNLILRINGEINQVYKISELEINKCHQIDDSDNDNKKGECQQIDDSHQQIDDSLSSDCLQFVTTLMTDCHQIDDRKSLEVFTGLVESIPHNPFHNHYHNHSHNHRACVYFNFLEKIKLEKYRIENHIKLGVLQKMFGEEKLVEIFNEVVNQNVHVLGVVDKIIQILFFEKEESIRKTEIMSIIQKGYTRLGDIKEDDISKLNKLEIKFLEHYGMYQLSKTNTHEINFKITEFLKQGENLQ